MSLNVETELPRVPMDPRIRQRRITVRREAGRRRLRVLLAAVAAVAVTSAAFAVTRSPLLDVDTVRVTGAGETPPADAVRAAGLAGRRQMVDLDPTAIAAAVGRLPWVARATVHRRWPGTVEIRVSERKPVALVESQAGVAFLLDRSGRVLGTAPDDSGLPAIGGAGEVTGAGADLDSAAPALAVLQSLPVDLPAQRVELTPVGVEVELATGTVVRLGAAVDLQEKGRALETLADRVDLRRVALVDLRVPGAPALTRR